MALRTRRIIDTNCVTVSCVATASSNNVESSARRCLFANTFVDAITSRTASKIRSGRSDRRSRLRHCVNVVGWNPASVIDRPHATFQRRSVANAWVASRSDNPSSDCNTSTDAITSAGCDGRPRPDGNRSANASSGNRRRRCSARNAYTESAGTRCDTNAAASNNSTFGSELPCIPQFSFTPPKIASLSPRIVQQSPSRRGDQQPGRHQLLDQRHHVGADLILGSIERSDHGGDGAVDIGAAVRRPRSRTLRRRSARSTARSTCRAARPRRAPCASTPSPASRNTVDPSTIVRLPALRLDGESAGLRHAAVRPPSGNCSSRRTAVPERRSLYDRRRCRIASCSSTVATCPTRSRSMRIDGPSAT